MADLAITLDFSSSIPFYKQIHDQVIFALKTGLLKPGEKIYPAQNLAKKLGVSINTVLKTYRILELEGYLVKRRGYGAYIAGKGGNSISGIPTDRKIKNYTEHTEEEL
ncbi:MAG: GntR family transcriptional regulator [Spirochaetales bacterium]|nr:GntR family transcriptional regulator [Spirochaetales bacterium]